MDEAKIPRIVGKPDGWKPITELGHFMTCPVCGLVFDMRELENVGRHWHEGPEAPVRIPGSFPG